MSDIDTQEPLSNSSDSSFVILSQGSLPPQEKDIPDSSLTNKTPISDSLINNKSTFLFFESTKSSDDDKFKSNWLDGSNIYEINMQKKFNELVKENYQLKETLNQNNLAIKSQLDKFFMWQQEVLKTHETHKQKFLETKDLILKLRSENTSLKKQLENSLPGFLYLHENETYAEVYKKSENLGDVIEKVKEYEKICRELTIKNEKLYIENKNLIEESNTAKNENFLLQQELDAVKKENECLKEKTYDSLESKSHKSLPNSEARTQISNLLKQLEEEKGKVLRLKEILKKYKPSLELSTTEELNNFIDNLDDMNASLEKQNQRFTSLQSWVSLAEENVEKNKLNKKLGCNIIHEIQELKSHLNQEENLFKEKQESIQELKKQFNRLLEDYKALQSKLMLVKNNESVIEKYKEELSGLSNKLQSKDKELTSLEQKCDNLNETIKELTLKCEEVAVLKVQAQQFQADFNEERAEREKLAEKKEEMAEQIRYLQRKIQSLEQSSSNNSTQSPLESPRRSHFLCPKCFFSFSSLKVCEEHIDECLGLD